MHRCLSLVITLAVFSFGNTLECQTLEQVLEYSGAEFKCGNYPVAAREYQRAWLFCEDSLKPGLEIRIADCFYRLDEYDRAIEFYGSALRSTADDSTRNEILMEIATCHIRAKEFFYALTDLASVNVGDSGYLAEKRWFLTGICNWGINRHDEAFTCFYQSIPGGNRVAKEKITELKSDFSAIRYPNPRLAGWLSIIPGAGQFYCLEFGPGLNSLVLCGSLMIAGYYSLIVFKSNVFLLNLLPWIQRYYAGGIIQAKGLAESKFLAKQNRIYQSIIDVIAENRSLN